MLQKVMLFFSSIKQQNQSKNQSEQSNQKTKICKRCFKEIKEASFHNLLYKDAVLCHKCLLEMKPVFNEFKIGKIEATNIYWYTEAIQSMLYQFKGCNDFELKEVFLDYYFLYFKEKYSGYTIIPAPSSKEANERRGFNQVTEMFKKMKLPLIDCCYKTKDYEQHNLASEERKQTGKLIEIKDVDLSKTKVLLVDDVYTTGSTIKKMIELVQKRGAKKIRVLVMAKTIDLDLRQ